MAWDDTMLPAGTDGDGDGYEDYFAGYQWLEGTDPDSAGTMSAIVTGKKVYRGGINVDGLDPVHGGYIDQVDLEKVMRKSVK